MPTDLDSIISEALAGMTGDATEPAEDAGTDEADESTEQQSPEATEPEADEADAEETEGEEDGQVHVELDTLLTLPDGRTVSVKDGIELKADYTRKTQELASQRKEVEGVYTQLMAWRDSVIAQPAEFVAELVTESKADPAGLARTVLATTSDPTAALAQLIQHMLDDGSLTDDFIEAFGLEAPDHAVRAKATNAKADARLERLERELAERREADNESATQAKLLNDYEHQIDAIIASEGLDPSGRDALVVELISFAQESGLVDNLAHAYAVLAYRKERDKQAASAAAARKAAAKRAASVMAPSGASAAGRQAEPVHHDSYESAAAAALAEILGKKRS
jgi:hypothetical protein